jgi:hypothetical protein
MPRGRDEGPVESDAAPTADGPGPDKGVSGMRRIVSVLVVSVFALLALAEPAWARIVRVDRAVARGDYAIAVAGGDVDRPRRIWVRVKADPNQRVDVSWTVVCSRGYGAGSRDGDFSAVTPFTRRLAMPYRRPDGCTVSAAASLSGRGNRIVVIILARVPG